jgi:integrase
MRYTDPLTGKRVAKSTETDNRTKAERAAAKWEADLNAGRYAPPSRVTWEDFRTRYADEVLTGLAKKTGNQLGTVFNTIDRILSPKRLADVTADRLSHVASQMRAEGKSPFTIRNYLAHLKASFRWAADVGLLPAVPKFPKIARVKGKKMKGAAEQALSRFLCQPSRVRYLLASSGNRPSNMMAKWFNASFQCRTGIVPRCDASRIAM